MEKIVNDIFNDCEEKLDFYQLESLISNLEILAESKESELPQEDYEESPAEQVARENCEAIL